MFLREFVPQTLRDSWRAEFEQLRQGTMSVSEYAVRFSDLSRHTSTLVSTVREQVRRFIEGISHDIWFCMARDSESNAPFQQVVEIARQLEGMRDHKREDMRDQERVDREAKRPRRPGGHTNPYFGGRVQHGKGFMGHPV
ncbi:uncharacterized protein [Nicotiana tomentosiformis]|uniref:uncharacterized protein n=1 Tax=Nicotiana tomentosiformis TaxID=4098 RepID=UPI00388C8DF8